MRVLIEKFSCFHANILFVVGCAIQPNRFKASTPKTATLFFFKRFISEADMPDVYKNICLATWAFCVFRFPQRPRCGVATRALVFVSEILFINLRVFDIVGLKFVQQNFVDGNCAYTTIYRCGNRCYDIRYFWRSSGSFMFHALIFNMSLI